ncbi:MAG: DUF2064 domain-containing protein [Planctomycetes bacterium]|nr:DUF2064 domain-containing protein [Planctomycetota bacterium]
MAKPESSPRPLALIATRPIADAKLAAALRDDLTELLQFIRLRVVANDSPDELAKTAAAHDGPCLITFSDVAGIPADCVEGALEMLEGPDVVIGPCADGSIYLIAAEGLDEAGFKALIDAALAPDGLVRCIPLLEQAGLEAAALPPWFRVANEKDVSFANSLARLSLMSDEGENDFIADRLRVWLEKPE